jgi:hypothetical protein
MEFLHAATSTRDRKSLDGYESSSNWSRIKGLVLRHIVSRPRQPRASWLDGSSPYQFVVQK